MPTRTQKARKQSSARETGEIPDLRANPQSISPPIAKEDPKWLQVVEHPLLLVVLAISGAIAGVIFFAPALLLCVVCILLALHRSKVLKGEGKFFQVTTYLIVLLVSTPLLLGFGVLAKDPVREYIRVARGGKPRITVPSASAPATASTNSLPLPGGIFAAPGLGQMAATPTTNIPKSNAAEEQLPANSAEAALIRQMREKLTADAGDPQKIQTDVQWMRDQFELGWAQEPPELAKKHREETEQTARMILGAASNRAAILQLVPHITIDK
jgi:hypothetical protein